MRLLDAPLLLRALIAIAVIAAAIGLQLTISELPRFLALLPAVLIAGFLGGRWFGGIALLLTSVFAVMDFALENTLQLTAPFLLALGCFILAGGLAVALMDLHRQTAARLTRERVRLQAALRAAHAAVWEISPDGRLYWDDNFYRLVGLPPRKGPPSVEDFLAMIDPRDRPRMAEARARMSAGEDPPPTDEYRLTRRDGQVVWLENHRTRVSDDGNFFIGITQDVTRRKLAEEQVQALLSESEHRAKNQFAVIMAVARETRRASSNTEEFEAAFASRLQALSRSHDLMVKGEWLGASLRSLVNVQLEPFAPASRFEATGPDIVLTPSSAQYLGIALHELATNAAKYGALAGIDGRIAVSWEVTEEKGGARLQLVWKETGGPSTPAAARESPGFGTRVLLEIVPAALGGEARRGYSEGGMFWEVAAPLENVAARGPHEQAGGASDPAPRQHSE